MQTRSGTPSSSTDSSPVSPQFPPVHDDAASQSFTESLMAQIRQLPNQPNSLPPSFITSFVRRCFPPELVLVDFPQALTGLDYLKDLETRRRREVAGAMARLDIDNKHTFEEDVNGLADRYPGVIQWIKTIEEKERKIEASYTQLYIALRRWILINELSLQPFNKHNCVAMLNTLYPPVMSTPPTSKLTAPILKQQRDGFFKYIQGVEKSGPRILGNLMAQGKAPTEDNGWPAVCRTLGMYLQLANSIIAECHDISQVSDVSPRKEKTGRQARKVDSGVSFGSSASSRPSTSGSDPPASPTEITRPKTLSGSSTSRPGTAMEKLARGLKSIGRSRTDVTEMVDAHPPLPAAASSEATTSKPRGLRKMRSMGALGDRNGSKMSLHASARAGSDAPAFDAEEMRRQRQKYEAASVGSRQHGYSNSHEV